MNKLERKFGKYAIPHLPLILIICYGIGYILQIADRTGNIRSLICLNPYLVVHGQVWRLLTWVLIPPSSFDFFTIIMLLFYYSIGRTLEQVWGSFRYNIYIFSGMLFTIIGSLLLMGYMYLFPDQMIYTADLATEMQLCGLYYFSTYYINMSIFLACACTVPNNMVLLMFFIPITMKWLGIAYAVLLVYQALAGDAYSRVVIVMSLLNFILFFFLYRKKNNQTIQQMFKQAQRKREYEQRMHAASSYTGYDDGAGHMSKHRCAICGRTELDNPDLQFRFCSKCNGNYEYCNEHLFNHRHVE